MTTRTVLSAILVSGFSLACTPADSDPSAGTAMSAGTTTDEAETGETETGEGGPDLGICEQYIDCIEAAAPETLTATKALYGTEGTCWSLGGVTESDCHTECRALLRAIIEAFPEVEECFECVEDSDCTSNTPYCHNGDRLCWDEPQVLSCDFWEPVAYCREFGEGFTTEEKRIWCAALDESFPPELVPDGWKSERSTPCKTEGTLGRCDYFTEGDPFENLAPGPVSIYYYDHHPEITGTADELEMFCINELGGTWFSL